MLSFQEEKFAYILEELEPLLLKHWKELANYKDQRPLDIDYIGYTKLNAEGIIRIFTVRNDGILIGYSSWVIANNLHYQTWKHAVCDVYYLEQEYRKTGVAAKMFDDIEERLKVSEVKLMTLQDKVTHSHNKLFISRGYMLTEQNYEKVF